jgi:hypothetical protein
MNSALAALFPHFCPCKWTEFLVPISPTFYEQLLRQNPLAKKLQTQIVSTRKVRKELWFEKAACKLLVKLTVIPKFFPQLSSAYNLGL